MNFGKIDPVGCFDKVGRHKWSHDELPFQFMRDNVARFRNRGGDDDDSFNGVTTLVLHRGGGRRQTLASYCEDDSLGGHQLED